MPIHLVVFGGAISVAPFDTIGRGSFPLRCSHDARHEGSAHPAGTIHRSAWKEHSRKSECSIMHRPRSDVPTREGAVRPPWWRKLLRGGGPRRGMERDGPRPRKPHTLYRLPRSPVGVSL